MRIYDSYRPYAVSRTQEEAFYARHVADPEVQLRIAKNSNNRTVLNNLALNKELSEEAVQALYGRELNYLTNRLNNLGYESSIFTDIKNWINL